MPEETKPTPSKPRLWVVEIKYPSGDWLATSGIEATPALATSRRRNLEMQVASLYESEKRPVYRVRVYERVR